MEATGARPTAISVIGWGAIVVAVLMTFSGAMAALLSSAMPEIGARPERPTPIDFVFEHFTLFAAGQVVVGAVLGVAGRALLSLRRWGAHVIQAVACLGLVWFVGGTAVFLAELLPLLSASQGSERPGETVTVFMLATAVFTALFYGTPLLLTIYHLQKRRGMLG